MGAEVEDKVKVRGVSPLSIFYSFVPYILVSLFSGEGTFLLVTGISFAMSAAWMIYGLVQRRGLHQLSTVGTIVFGLMLVGALVDPNLETWIISWSGTIAEIALVLTAFIGILVKRPFTLYYAKFSVDQVQWDHNPEYRAAVISVSQKITGVWGLSFLITALCDFADNATNNGLVFNWIIPIAVLFGAVRFTLWYPNYIHEKVQREHPEIEEQHRKVAEEFGSQAS